MTGRYEGQQPNSGQDGEKLLRIMAMAAQAAGAQQAPADTRPAEANPGGMSEGDRMVTPRDPAPGAMMPCRAFYRTMRAGAHRREWLRKR